MKSKRNKQYDVTRLVTTLDAPDECSNCGIAITEGWERKDGSAVLCAECVENVLTRQARTAAEQKSVTVQAASATSGAEQTPAAARGRK